jgi:hypothetical protein
VSFENEKEGVDLDKKIVTHEFAERRLHPGHDDVQSCDNMMYDDFPGRLDTRWLNSDLHGKQISLITPCITLLSCITQLTQMQSTAK